MTTANNSIKTIIKDLEASDVRTVLDAIKRNRKDGNGTSFEAMLQLLLKTDEPDVEAAIVQFLFDLKDEESIGPLISAIQNKDFEYYHSFLVATFWQSALDGSSYLEVFVKAAIKGDYMVCLEALTVIENFDSSYNEQDLLEYEDEIKEAEEKESQKEKKDLLRSLADVVRNLPIEGE